MKERSQSYNFTARLYFFYTLFIRIAAEHAFFLDVVVLTVKIIFSLAVSVVLLTSLGMDVYSLFVLCSLQSTRVLLICRQTISLSSIKIQSKSLAVETLLNSVQVCTSAKRTHHTHYQKLQIHQHIVFNFKALA